MKVRRTVQVWGVAALGTTVLAAGLLGGTSGAVAAAGPVQISELAEANWAGLTDSSGGHPDWVELHNTSTAAVDLSGYGLSDRDDSPLRWRLPAGTKLAAGAYLTVLLSGDDGVYGGQLHAGFSVDNGDPVQLSTPAGVVLDAVNPKKVRRDTSWCRTGAAGDFAFCATPTPGAANSGASYPTLLKSPTFSVPGGLYDTATTVAISGPTGATLRYTRDGSEPTASSSVYSAPLKLTTATTLRAAAFAAGAMSSTPTTASYVVATGTKAKYAGSRVILVAMSPADATRHANGAKDVKFASNVQMLGTDGSTLFAEDAETDVPGQIGSLVSPQKGLDVSFRDAFGAKSVKSTLIPDRPVTEYKRFRLRNGGNDWSSTRLRDVHAAALGHQGPNLTSGFVPTHVFINAKYYGFLELREKEDETLVESYLGVDNDTVDFISDPLLAAQDVDNGVGALANYRAMYAQVTGTDQSVPANYARSTQLLDPVSLSADWVLHIFTGNTDWPDRNVHVWRSPAADGRWHWQPHDFDRSLGIADLGPALNTQIIQGDDSALYSAKGSELVKALLKSPSFKATYLNAAADLLNTAALPSVGAKLLDTEAAKMKPYVALGHDRFFLTPDSAAWARSVATQRTYVQQRGTYFDSQTRKYFGVSARQTLGVTLESKARGDVLVNSVDVADQLAAGADRWAGKYYPEAPVTLTAVPKPGYVFAGWSGASTSTARTITLPVTTATEVTARFVAATADQKAVVTKLKDRSDTVGDVVRLQVVAADASGLPLRYTAKGLPSGLDLNPTEGVVYGKLSKPDTDSVTITVDNGVQKTKVSFDWTVVNP